MLTNFLTFVPSQNFSASRSIVVVVIVRIHHLKRRKRGREKEGVKERERGGVE